MRILTTLAILVLAAPAAAGGSREEQLWRAAREGDEAAVRSLLAEGVDVNAATEYGMTALLYAVDWDHEEVVKLLLRAGADVRARNTAYNTTPLGEATVRDEAGIVALLLKHGAPGAGIWIKHAAAFGSADTVRALLDSGRLSDAELAAARAQAEGYGREEIVSLIDRAAKGPLPHLRRPPPDQLRKLAGRYESDEPQDVELRADEGFLLLSTPGRGSLRFFAAENGEFQCGVNTLVFQRRDGRVTGFTWISPYRTSRFVKLSGEGVSIRAGAAPALAPEEAPAPADREFSSVQWPSFRGAGARGISSSRPTPTRWNVEESAGVRWKTPIPGLAHSSPIVWDDKLFVTTAVSSAGGDSIRIGLYGATNSAEDQSVHSWRIYCLDKRNGRILWERIAHTGKPPVKRHMKSSQCNSTPATDGRRVVALFASGGLYCYDFSGHLLWERDLGVLDSGAFDDPGQQWGFGSSPIIYKDRVIVQCDIQRGSYIAAYAVDDGRTLWRKDRDEPPSWGTPTVIDGPPRPVLAANATKFARGYDPRTGAELWRLSGNSYISVPTPLAAYGLIFVSSGYHRPIEPIYAIRMNARGDISLKPGETSNQFIAWSKSRGGPYLPTPIVYEGYLYTCANNGILTCYRALTGDLVYRKRFARPEATSFAASPVAADGKLYLTSEAGLVYVVRAGPKYELLAENPAGEYCLATPAISEGAIFLRTRKHVVAIGAE